MTVPKKEATRLLDCSVSHEGDKLMVFYINTLLLNDKLDFLRVNQFRFFYIYLRFHYNFSVDLLIHLLSDV